VTGRGLCLTGRVRSAFNVCAYFSLMIGRTARPVTVDRTRPVVQGAYWTPTGRWHCGVRSVLQRVRSLFCCALLRLDQRVRSFRELTGLQPDSGTVAFGQFYSASDRCFVERCSGLTSASGQLRDQRVRSHLARPVCVTSASRRCFAA
jgi:hypothetical protein